MKINHKQFAYVMKMDPDGARRMMCHAYAKHRGWDTDTIQNGGKRSNYIDDDFPKEMEVDMLMKHLNIPHLQMALDEVRNNILKRSATRGYIMEFPQGVIDKHIEKHGESTTKRCGVHLRPVIISLISEETRKEILDAWTARYKHKYPFVVFD